MQFISHFFGFDKGETGGKREVHHHSKNDAAIEDPTETDGNNWAQDGEIQLQVKEFTLSPSFSFQDLL